MADVSYVPGGRTAIAGDSCWVLIDASPDSAVVAEIWRRMGLAGPMPQARLEELFAGVLQFGFAHMPDFALLACGGDGRRHLICRGSGGAVVEDLDGSAQRVTGAGLATWLDYPMPAGVTCVVIGEPATESSLRLPASAGIFLASSVIVDLSGAGQQSRPMPVTAPAPGWPAPAPAPVLPAGDEAGDPGYDFLFEATQMRSVEDAAIRPDSGGDSLFSFPGGSSFPGFGSPPEPHAQILGSPVPASPLPAGPVLGGPVPGTLGPESAPPAEWPLAPSAPPPPAAPVPLDGPGGGGMIDRVPWESAPPPLPASLPAQPAAPLDPTATLPPRALISTITVPPPLPPGSFPASGPLPGGEPFPGSANGTPPDPGNPENTNTIRRASLAQAVPVPALVDRIGPIVQGLLCLAGHVSPPNSVACRVCGEPLPPQEPVLVSRPALGLLRLSTGDVITLDRSVVMGRNPRSELNGDERPHVVKLPSGDGEISRTHLTITLDGWHVLLTDLESTNGTLVEFPGRPPERLRPKEPVLIPNATVVTLADGIYFRFEVAG